MRPVSFDSAPYFMALVQSSCSAMTIATASFGGSMMRGPESDTRSRFGAPTFSVSKASRSSDAFSQFAWVSRLCATPSAKSLPSNAF